MWLDASLAQVQQVALSEAVVARAFGLPDEGTIGVLVSITILTEGENSKTLANGADGGAPSQPSSPDIASSSAASHFQLRILNEGHRRHLARHRQPVNAVVDRAHDPELARAAEADG